MRDRFDFFLLVASLVGGFAAWLLTNILYAALLPAIGRPAMIALMFVVFLVVISLVVLSVSLLRGNFSTPCLCFSGTPLLMGGLAALFVVGGLLAMGLEWVYDHEQATVAPPSSYIFLIDESGSMSSNDPTGQRYEALSTVLENEPDSFPYAVYRFASDMELVRPMGPISDGEGSYSLIAEGGTAIRGSLQGILDALDAGELDGGKSPRVILLTDGYAGDIGFFSSIDSVLKQYVRRGITISTVGLGSVDNALMQNIADTTGGAFILVEQAQQLPDALAQAAYARSDRDLLSARPAMENNLLYGFMRILFLLVLGAVAVLAKTIACGRDSSAMLTLVVGGICAVLAALLMEFAIGLGVPVWFCRLLFWLLLAVTPAMCAGAPAAITAVEIYHYNPSGKF